MVWASKALSFCCVIQQIADQCLVANEKNLASRLRVICLKYLKFYSKPSTSFSVEIEYCLPSGD